ncbi:MAG: hypothetical protein U0807_07470 [Candidatus Binatia bacterium]
MVHSTVTLTIRALAAAVLFATATAHAATVTWSGATDGDWNKATNWVGGTVPAANDDVVIPAAAGASATVTFAYNATNYPPSGVASMNSLTCGKNFVINSGELQIATTATVGTVGDPKTLLISGGTFSGAGTATLTALFTWQGGSIKGLTVSAGAITFSTTTKYLDAAALTTAGNTNFNAGYLYLMNGATLTIASTATFDFTADSLNIAPSTGGGTLVNNGKLRKTAGSGTVTIGVPVTNNGAGLLGIDVQSGTLSLNGGGTSPGVLKGAGTLDFGTGYSSTFNVSGPVTANAVTFTYSGTHNFTGTGANAYNVPGGTSLSSSPTVNFTGDITATGPLVLNGGTVNFNTGATIALASLNFQSGTLGGTDTINVASLTWNSGTMQDSGTTTVAGTSTLSGSTKTLNGRTLRNTGTMNWTAGYLSFSNAGTLQNPTGATLDMKSDNTMSGGASGTFDNAGTFRKSGGAGSGTVGVAMLNSGTVQAQSGVLSLSQSYTQSAGVTQLAGGNIQAPYYTPFLAIQGGQLTGAGTITGNVTVSGAGAMAPGSSAGLVTITGTYTQGAGGTDNVELGGTATTDFDRVVLSSSGSTGLATLDGVLAVSRINAFTPNLGDTFQIMTFGSRSGFFGSLTGVNVGTGKFVKATYTSTAVNLTVVSENCYDDLDNDGDGKADCADPDCAGAQPKCSVIPTTTTTTILSTTTTTQPPTTTTTQPQVTTTSTTPPTTSTTLPLPAAESCGNCIDDDGDGLVDYEDPDCCAVRGEIQLKSGKFQRGKGGPRNGKLTLNTILGSQFVGVDPTTQPVTVQLSNETGKALYCFSAGAGKWSRRGKGFVFSEPLAPLIKGAMKATKKNTVTFATNGKNIDVSGFTKPSLTATVRVGDRCASATTSLKTSKTGQKFP